MFGNHFFFFCENVCLDTAIWKCEILMNDFDKGTEKVPSLMCEWWLGELSEDWIWCRSKEKFKMSWKQV